MTQAKVLKLHCSEVNQIVTTQDEGKIILPQSLTGPNCLIVAKYKKEYWKRIYTNHLFKS